MATYTPNNNLGKPEATDEFKDFRQLFNDNMDIIDNMGGGGSSTLAGLTDVTITTPVTGDALIYDGAEWANSALSAVAISGDYSDLLNAPSLAAVATSGDYTDLINTPSLATVATSGLYSDLSGTPSLATVATSGQYSDLSGTPSLATVATSGSYNDLTDKPTIPTVNDGTLTIQQNGTTVGTFTANQSGNTTVNLSGGGGSKHTIVNESGTALADEPNLQFTDGLTATDDSVNTKTKVGVDTTFTEAVTRTNIASGDSLSTIFGKIKKWFSDLASMFVSKSGDTMTGQLTINNSGASQLRAERIHTSTTVQPSDVVVGNNTADGTAGADYGRLALYGDGTKYTVLQARHSTENRTIGLPDATGTIALTSDIKPGSITFDSGGGSADTWTENSAESLFVDLSINGWNYVGEKTGTATLSYPAGATELYVLVSWHTSLDYAYDFLILVNGVGKYFVRANSSEDGTKLACIYISRSGRTVKIAEVKYNGSVVTSSAKIRLYYR